VWASQVRPFAAHYNLALVDFPGHHRQRVARPAHARSSYSFDSLVSELSGAIDAAGIARCHVVALSLGTILARMWASRQSGRIQSLVLAGTIADLTLLPRTLMQIGWYARWALPYMAVYRTYAWIIMPGARHRRTRQLFYRDARVLGSAEFNRWFDLAPDALVLLKSLRPGVQLVPTLHVMGSEDRMFLRTSRVLASEEGSRIHVIEGVGHVCSVEAATTFNEIALQFLRMHSVC
jgi:pimeloyl-ACP methyl ester carboxylesterase